MPGQITMPLTERITRYHEMKRLHFEEGMSYAEIGKRYDPPLPKQRVSKIVNGAEPRDPGRPIDQ